jgi:hypothetical protein
MSELLGALGGLVNKVATKTEDGLQRFAHKTEDVAKRVNRTVNPLSSHFRESSDARSSPELLRAGEHSAQSNPLAAAQSPYVDRPTRGALGQAPHGARGDAAACATARDNATRVEPPAIFLREGLSSKSALCMADEILQVVTRETTKLEAERDEYQHVLQRLQQLRKEQEEAYARSEALMLQREQELLLHIQAIEQQQDGVTVAF